MAPWLIMTGLGLDDSINLHLLVQSLVITINYNNSQSIFSRTLLPWLPRTRSFLVLVLRLTLIYDWTIYIVSRRIHRKHIRFLAMDICEPHRKHRVLYCCIYSALHSNGSYPIVACIFVAAGMCLPSSCQQTGVHVTIYWQRQQLDEKSAQIFFVYFHIYDLFWLRYLGNIICCRLGPSCLLNTKQHWNTSELVKQISKKLAFSVWATVMRTVVFLNIPPMFLHLGIWSP
jgi:hypothetical protein